MKKQALTLLLLGALPGASWARTQACSEAAAPSACAQKAVDRLATDELERTSALQLAYARAKVAQAKADLAFLQAELAAVEAELASAELEVAVLEPVATPSVASRTVLPAALMGAAQDEAAPESCSAARDCTTPVTEACSASATKVAAVAACSAEPKTKAVVLTACESTTSCSKRVSEAIALSQRSLAECPAQKAVLAAAPASADDEPACATSVAVEASCSEVAVESVVQVLDDEPACSSTKPASCTLVASPAASPQALSVSSATACSATAACAEAVAETVAQQDECCEGEVGGACEGAAEVASLGVCPAATSVARSDDSAACTQAAEPVASRYATIECPVALDKLAAIAAERETVAQRLADARRRLAEVRAELAGLRSDREE